MSRCTFLLLQMENFTCRLCVFAKLIFVGYIHKANRLMCAISSMFWWHSGEASFEISLTDISCGCFHEDVFLGVFPLSGGPCQRNLRTTPQASFQISSSGFHTWNLYVIFPSLGCPAQVPLLLGRLPGTPNFPGPVSSPFFECLWPTRFLAEDNC